MNYNDETDTICCGFINVESLPLTAQELYDNNDHEIFFINKTSPEKSPNEPIDFSSTRFELQDNCFQVRKVSYDKTIAIILKYQTIGEKRLLLDGFIRENVYDSKNPLKFDVKEYKVCKGENKWKVICTYVCE
jgi:hypothetical protein